MITQIILLALGAVSLRAVCMCKEAGEVDGYMEELIDNRTAITAAHQYRQRR